VPKPIVMPKFGYEVETAILVNWTKKLGDRVWEGEIVAEVEAAKGTAELEAPAAGVIVEILCQAGQEVPVGTVLGYVDDGV
jgi:pyruvate/2-oxoglutarate dehydrogenase complex dihydrolipoamide acyltransferase (E2) component